MLLVPWNSSWSDNCAWRHLGLWLAEPNWFMSTAQAISDGTWRSDSYAIKKLPDAKVEEPPKQEKIYQVSQDGIALIGIQGQMMKGNSKYGGANTIATRMAIRAAKEDPEVKAIMLMIDSPGGTVAGTNELAADVRAARVVKPVFAHVDDLGASAAYWVASQANSITASSTSEVGSIGTMGVVYDFSGSFEKKGIKVHVISTGAYKGVGSEGSPITDEQLAYFQKRVDDVNEKFVEGVSIGRGVSVPKVREWADGRVWIAETAREKGLIDGVMMFDDAVNRLRDVIQGNATPVVPVNNPPKRNLKAMFAELEKNFESELTGRVP